MDGCQILLLITILWNLFIVPSTTFGNSKLAAANDENTETRKLATQNTGSISIDCGVDEDYVDEETGIFYKSDSDFIITGENHEISPEYADENPYFGRQLKNVRIFPEGRRNCYTLQPAQGKNHNYYIIVFFRYGNYDAKHQIPRFDLYLGVNYWATVTIEDSSASDYYEIIHFSLTDKIYVCLVNTGFGIPLIAALELRLLNDSIYRIESGSLRVVGRYDLGSPTNQIVRYKDDVYDRVWATRRFLDWAINTTKDIQIQGTNDPYKPPLEVLRTAVQPQSGFSSLNYSLTYSYTNEGFYVYFYFAEILEIAQGQRREFTVTMNNVINGPFTLEYLKPLTVGPCKSPIRDHVSFIINSTVQSDLPPILNAFEILAVSPPPLSPTDQEDVDAIMAIKQTYKINREDWQGDPCMPREFSWSGLNCSNYSSLPRIISLNLSSSKLTGKIASSVANLKVIQSLDLSYNELTGTIPEFFAQLPTLTVLNLTGNNLTGSIPKSLIAKSINGLLRLSFDDNPNLCQTESCGKRKRSFLLPIVASAVVILVLLLFGIVAIFWRMKRQGVSKSSKESLLKSRNQPFTYTEVVSITSNFRHVIGEGGFGKVYFGNLQDGTQVAVKLLSQSSKQGYKEFQAEVQVLMMVYHSNLVSLIGYCEEKENIALVYEYMANGNLRQQLSDRTSALNWRERLQISVDAAYGLEYLHNGCKPPVIHRDLKTSNILLNENMQAKIADFGLSRVFATEEGSHVTTQPAGTFGYVDPEYHSSGNLNKKSDVYSFGIILLELITGKPAIIKGPGYSTHIVQWIHPILGGDIQNIVDPRLQVDFDVNSAWKVVEIAMSCVPPTAIQRPDMSHVLSELKECLAMEMAFGGNQRTQSNMAGFSNSLEMSTPSAR